MEYWANLKLPDHDVEFSTKTAKPWSITTMEYYIAKAKAGRDIAYLNRCFNAANGIVDRNEFNYLTRPITSGGEPDDDIAKEFENRRAGYNPDAPSNSINIRNTEFITEIRDKIIGEYIAMPYSYQITVENSDVILRKEKALADEVFKAVSNELIEKLNNDPFLQTQVESTGKIPDIRGFANKYVKNYLDKRASEGQIRSEYIDSINDLTLFRIDCFINMWTYHEFYTHCYIDDTNNVRYQSLDPRTCFPITRGERFAKDYEAFIIEDELSFYDIMQQHEADLKNSDKEYLSTVFTTFSEESNYAATYMERRKDNIRILLEIPQQYDISYDSTVTTNKVLKRLRVVIRTTKKIYEVLRHDSKGDMVVEEVEKGYKLNPLEGDIEIRSRKIEVVVEAFRIGDRTTGIYIPFRELPVQVYTANKTRAELPFGGTHYLYDTFIKEPAPVKLLPFVVLDSIMTYHIENKLSAFLPSLFAIPYSIIRDDKAGTLIEKMTYIKKENLLLYDDADVNPNTLQYGLKTMAGNAMADYIRLMVDIKEANKQSAFSKVSMNNARMGEAATTSKVGVVENNRQAAQMGMLPMLAIFNTAFLKEHVRNLEYGKYVYNNDRFYNYKNRNNEPVSVFIKASEYSETQFGILPSNSLLDMSKFQELRALGQAAAQNQKFDIAAEVITSDSIPEIRQRIKDIVEADERLSFMMEQQKNEATKYAADVQSQTDEAKRNFDMQMLVYREEQATYRTMLEMQGYAKSALPANSPVLDTMANMIKERELSLKERAQALNEALAIDTNKIKREKIQSDERIAKMNRNKYDKK